ncbi:hypothetical protein Tiera_013 [Polaromonas phage Tiera]|nr:hypothetical protein Tiera_013 [Polaromonas phage Tiera]
MSAYKPGFYTPLENGASSGGGETEPQDILLTYQYEFIYTNDGSVVTTGGVA